LRVVDRILAASPGGRTVWAAAGVWERFFLLAPVIWGCYAIGLLLLLALDPRLAADPRQPYQFAMVVGLIATFGVMVNPWRFPLILSARVLRSIADLPDFGPGSPRDETARSNAIRYLESSGQGGHWRRGNLLSLAYFIVYLAWGFIALNFFSFTRIRDGPLALLVFSALQVTSTCLMAWEHRHALRRLADHAAREGLPFSVSRLE
jgi:hypothetical protein